MRAASAEAQPPELTLAVSPPQLDEVRSKDRSIGQLERQLSAQSAKIRLQEEKVSKASSVRHFLSCRAPVSFNLSSSVDDGEWSLLLSEAITLIDVIHELMSGQFSQM